jgi:hypothetical protein
VVGLGTQYLVMWKNLPPGMSEKWGNKYAVFYTADQGGNYLTWSLSRLVDVAAMPGLRRFRACGGATKRSVTGCSCPR